MPPPTGPIRELSAPDQGADAERAAPRRPRATLVTAMAEYFRVKNFERFQHYKDRNPPWIRLYGALWRDRAFFRLPDALKAHLIGLFALAARLDNRIPDDPEWLAHELCASEPIDLTALAASGFLIPERQASGPVASGEPADTSSVSDSASDSTSVSDSVLEISASDLPITEDHRASKGAEQRRAGSSGVGDCPGDNRAQITREDPPRERRQSKRPEVGWPAGFALNEEMRRFARGLGIEPEAEFEAWRDDCAAHDRRYADWPAAWRSRCRNALKFARRPAGIAAPGETPIELALRRLREAREREGLKEAS